MNSLDYFSKRLQRAPPGGEKSNLRDRSGRVTERQPNPEGVSGTIEELAKREKVNGGYMSRVLVASRRGCSWMIC